MRHFISVHIFSFIYHIYFLLHKISTVFSYQNFYIPCIFDILYRLKILISIFLLFFIKGSDTQYPTRDKFCEYFKGIGIRDIVYKFSSASREGGGCKTLGWGVEWAHAHSKWLAYDSRYWHWPFSTGIRSFYYVAGGTRFRGLAQFQVHDAS